MFFPLVKSIAPTTAVRRGARGLLWLACGVLAIGLVAGAKHTAPRSENRPAAPQAAEEAKQPVVTKKRTALPAPTAAVAPTAQPTTAPAEESIDVGDETPELAAYSVKKSTPAAGTELMHDAAATDDLVTEVNEAA